MPVAGLVLTLTNERERARVTALLVEDPRLMVGDAQGAMLPVVTETGTVEEQQSLWDKLAALPGVALVDLAYLDFSDVEGFDVPLGRVRRAREPQEQ